MATLGNVEENDSVSRALARLAEVEEKVEALHQEQVSAVFKGPVQLEHNRYRCTVCLFNSSIVISLCLGKQ